MAVSHHLKLIRTADARPINHNLSQPCCKTFFAAVMAELCPNDGHLAYLFPLFTKVNDASFTF